MALKNNVTKKYYDLMKARDQSEKSLGKLENRPFSSPLGRLFVILFSVATSLYSGITGVNSAVDDSSVVGKLFGFLPAGTVGTVLLWVISLLGLWLFEILSSDNIIPIRIIRKIFGKLGIAVAVFLLVVASAIEQPIVMIIVALALILYSCKGAEFNISNLICLRQFRKKNIEDEREKERDLFNAGDYEGSEAKRKENNATVAKIERRAKVGTCFWVIVSTIIMTGLWYTLYSTISAALASAIAALALVTICEVIEAARYPEGDVKIKMMIDAVDENKLENAKRDLQRLREAYDSYESARNRSLRKKR